MRHNPLLRFVVGGCMGGFIAATAMGYCNIPMVGKIAIVYVAAVICALGAIGLYRNK